MTIPAISKYPNAYRGATEWRFDVGTSIVVAFMDREKAGPFEEYWVYIYEVTVDGVHIASSDTLEHALDVLDKRYRATLPF